MPHIAQPPLLQGHSAIVTGGSSGIGLAIVRIFAENGAKVLFTGRDAAKGEAVRASLHSAGFSAEFVCCDMADHAADGIRINALCPGDTDTPMLDASSASGDRAAMLARLGVEIPMGRVANPDEIAKAALFLASPQTSFVTGIALPVDGGASTG